MGEPDRLMVVLQVSRSRYQPARTMGVRGAACARASSTT